MSSEMADQQAGFEIIVDTVPRAVQDARVTWEQVVEIGYPGQSGDTRYVFKVQYEDAASQPSGGTLVKGGHVRKGEKGIAIIAPVVSRVRVKDEETGTESVITGSPKAFRLAHVFDVSQTDGADLPEAPMSKLQGDDEGGLYTKLRGVANSLGFTVDEDYLDGGKNGYCDHTQRHIRIEVRNEPRQQLKTLAHELAHAILHESRDGLTRERAELEAESVAYMVCADLGVDSGDYTFGYVATWAGGGDEAITALKASAQRIQKTAAQILDLLGADGAGQGSETAVAA